MHADYRKIFQASLLVALSGILYGFLGYFGTGILRENTSISTMLFWRFFIAGCWMILFVIKKNSTQQVINPINKHILLFMFFIGAIGYAGSAGFYFIATQYIGTGLAMVIFFSYPIVVALFSWMVQRKQFNLGTVFALLVMMIGLFLLQNSTEHSFSVMGIIFSVIAAICYAFYLIGSKKFSSIIIDSNILTIMVCFGCAFIFLTMAISTGSFVFPNSIKNWIYLLVLGILVTALPIQLMLEGLKHVSAMRASIISVLEPLVTVFVGILLLDEAISYSQALGSFLILGSTLLVQFQRKL